LGAGSIPAVLQISIAYPMENSYNDILEEKKPKLINRGFILDKEWSHLYPFQSFCVRTALEKGKYALFEGCGLGKTRQQITWAHEVMIYTGRPCLILAPLAVVGQTIEEGEKIGIEVIEYVPEMYTLDPLPSTIFISNYEQLDNLPVEQFAGIVLDESSILKSFTGTTKRKLIEAFCDTPYKLACTATPSPNDLNEIGNHSEFLDVLDAQDMRAKWFVRDEGMNNYRLKGHAKADFYAWMRTWCKMFNNPADIGFPMDGYNLPAVNYQEVIIKAEVRNTGKLFNEGHVNATSFHREVKLTMVQRLEEVATIVNNSTENFIIWIEQNEEGERLRELIPDAVEVRGSDKTTYKKDKLLGFARNEFRVLITKGEIAGFGMNYQNCHNMIFANPSFSFETIYQCICRELRFGQFNTVNVWMVSTDTMENVVANYKIKEKQHFEMLEEMNNGINHKIYGLLTDYTFREVRTSDCWLMKGDCCIESKRIADKAARLIVYSPPFSALFTYSNYIHDMGNNDSHEAFFRQYAYQLKENYRILQDGGIMCCHTKNLGVYKNSSGYTGMYDFTGDHTRAVLDAGFKLHCIITIWTDPVLEMQRTKTQRLLYKTVTSDSSYTGVGMPEFIYVFRKWDGNEEDWSPVTNLTKKNFPLDKWQEWASPVYRENLLNYEKADLVSTILQLKAETFRLKYDCNSGLPDHWYDDVWFDIKRTDVLNGKEGTALGDEKHIAPLQLEVNHRCVNLWSNKGDTIFTPFLGIGSELYEAVLNDRKGIGIELKDSYFDVSVRNILKAETSKLQTKLFV